MYLYPKELLYLSRLSKQFRSMFASRSAIFVWQTVYLNADLNWYEDLNEMQFASLCFDQFCMVTFFPFLYHINYISIRDVDVSQEDACHFPCFV